VPSSEGYADLPTSTHPQYMSCVGYGIDNFQKMFTNRQRWALKTYCELVAATWELVKRDAVAAGLVDDDVPIRDGGTGASAYADAVATYLGLATSKLAAAQSNLGVWKPSMEQAIAAFGRQALPMTWDFPESNIFNNMAGDIKTTIHNMMRVLDDLVIPCKGSIFNADAANSSFDYRPAIISTDPPYYDNIPYADLSDFFYVWLRRSVGTYWPDLFRRLAVPKMEELVADNKRHEGRDNAERFFLAGMGKALARMRDVASQSEPLAIFYAFKQSEVEEGIASPGWSTFLQAVIDAGFSVDGTWPVRTELVTALKSERNALASSIVLVCKKLSADAPVITRTEFIRHLKRELPTAIEAIRRAGVGPVDMQQSVIGPGMGVFSRYTKVLQDDDEGMAARAALATINRVWEEIENEIDASFDPETQVALAWYATYGFDSRPSGELIALATAKNTSDRALFASGVFQDFRGRAGLTPRDALPRDWTPASDRTLTVWECAQHSARVLNASDGGGEAAARLVAQMGPLSADARKLAYRLFEIATNKGWAAEALVYNELAQEWPKLEDIAAGIAVAAQGQADSQGTFGFAGDKKQ
jgi:putative DNA methylase